MSADLDISVSVSSELSLLNNDRTLSPRSRVSMEYRDTLVISAQNAQVSLRESDFLWLKVS